MKIGDFGTNIISWEAENSFQAVLLLLFEVRDSRFETSMLRVCVCLVLFCIILSIDKLIRWHQLRTMMVSNTGNSVLIFEWAISKWWWVISDAFLILSHYFVMAIFDACLPACLPSKNGWIDWPDIVNKYNKSNNFSMKITYHLPTDNTSHLQPLPKYNFSSGGFLLYITWWGWQLAYYGWHHEIKSNDLKRNETEWNGIEWNDREKIFYCSDRKWWLAISYNRESNNGMAPPPSKMYEGILSTKIDRK